MHIYNMYMYVCVCVYIYIYIYICVHIFIHMYALHLYETVCLRRVHGGRRRRPRHVPQAARGRRAGGAGDNWSAGVVGGIQKRGGVSKPKV